MLRMRPMNRWKSNGILTWALSAAFWMTTCTPSIPVQESKMKVQPRYGQVAPAPNGLQFPHQYRNWQILSVTHRDDSQTMRIVVGNNVAAKAARRRHTDPWPDGSIIGNLIWKENTQSPVPQSLTIDTFLRAEFMFKNVSTFGEGNNTGWGWARWTGPELTPYGKDKSFVNECIACHTKASSSDWVFSSPVVLP